MVNKFKRYSIVTLATLVILGCGSNDNDNTNNITAKSIQDLNTFSDAEKLAYAVANQKNAIKTDGAKNKNSREVQSCENDGTTEFTFPDNMGVPDYTQPYIKYENCLEDGETLNGEMKFSMGNSYETGSITYITDFTSTGGEDEVFIKAGGTITMSQEGDWEVLLINLEMTFNGITRGGEDLIYKGKGLADGGFIEFPVSGKEKIGNSVYFMVDPSYDASQTPFKSNKEEQLVNGMFKYLDEDNNSVELEITSKDIVTVRIDQDGDGKFSENEISTIDLAK